MRREILVIRESRLKSSILIGVNVGIGVGEGGGEGVVIGAAVLTATPLFQTNFLPDLIHV